MKLWALNPMALLGRLVACAADFIPDPSQFLETENGSALCFSVTVVVKKTKPIVLWYKCRGEKKKLW